MSPNGSSEGPLPPTRLPDEIELHKDRGEGPLPHSEELLPPRPDIRLPRSGPPQMPTPPTMEADEVRHARTGPPTMPTPATYDADEVRKARTGPPNMPTPPSFNPDEVRAARKGPPNMPTMPSYQPDEVRAPRQGAPSMPHLSVPHPDEVRGPRQGPPRMPNMKVPQPDEVKVPRQGPPRMPTMASPEPGHVRADRRERDHSPPPLATPREFEVKQDLPTRTELPPLAVDPGRVEIEAEGMRRKVRVMTTGVFDLLHLGHIHMLEAARRLGDELYVVIARDETVRKMKHEPLNGEEVRRQIVENLKPVTKAVLGHVGDIYRTVQDVQPDIIALGFDQKFTEEEVRRKSHDHGVAVRVVRLPQFDHDLDATRKIIERIGDRIAKKELYTHEG